ncbi:Tn7 transposase TnsA N-terminal domain-containing protein [Bordetella bronchiseptica]|uniref:Tn7 transposase TnsA N-terminal domain-containing protein n=1 Tax=Bordetella bronchiseptica TaxID=518 RepID=UPI00046170AA|nr:Tn7 transposase TnsA N-terminal domain-containing protein [Bordetella bronchiseptica]KDC57261.1 TnsA endonuclease N-terminal domain protein [Bordetella bronchiseptica MBORD591]
MLDKAHLVELFDRLGTPHAGRRLVEKARIEAPVRRVRSRGGNVLTLLVSQKMGREIRTESRHVEFAAAVNHEHDPEVLEYYAQPCRLPLELIEAATGGVHRIQHFPDFLVIRAGSITLEEWKSATKLQGLAEKSPYRYEQDNDGQWRAPQIERQLAELGICYRICVDESIPPRRIENLLHLSDYFLPAAEPCDEQELRRLQAALAEHGSLYIADLTEKPYGFSPDFLFKAIADQLAVADLDREVLSKPRHCQIYRDATLRDFIAQVVPAGQIPGQSEFVLEIAEGTRFRFEGQVLTISLIGEKEIVCTRSQGDPVTLTHEWLTDAFEKGQIASVDGADGLTLDLGRYTAADLDLALQRKAILLSAQNTSVSERTKRYWKARQAAAQANGANEVLALVPQIAARGNRTSRLSEEQEDLVLAVINKYWRSHEAANYKSCYRRLIVLCDTRWCALSFLSCVDCPDQSRRDHARSANSLWQAHGLSIGRVRRCALSGYATAR